MSSEAYVHESIDLEPPIAEEELRSRIDAGEYRKITWDDPRLGEGYFVQVGDDGTIGIAVIPVSNDGGGQSHKGVAIQANPISEVHGDGTLEAELRKIIIDFGSTPEGMRRLFSGAIYIEKNSGEEKIVVRDGKPNRIAVG